MAKNKLAKFAEMELLPNVFQPKNMDILRADYHLKGRWREEVFRNDGPLVLEIGCGKGEYAVELGRMYPEKNFIGLDIKGARMWKGAKAASEAGMKNVAFVRMYAELLASVFAPGRSPKSGLPSPIPRWQKPASASQGRVSSPFTKRYWRPRAHPPEDRQSFPLRVHDGDHPREPPGGGGAHRGLVRRRMAGRDTRHQDVLRAAVAFPGKKIKYIRFSVPAGVPLTEPEVEIERDDYHSETRFMVPRTNTNEG